MSASLEFQHVTLRIRNLTRSAEFYRRIGFAVIAAGEDSAELGTSHAGPALLRLIEDRSAPRESRDAAGLFHVALLFPTRGQLGGWLHRATQQGVEFDGFSDHAVSEAIYFSDPDGNGLEFYADRARELWPFAGDQIAMVTRPLDTESLLAAAHEPATALAGCHWGHLHLRVTHLEQSETFYRSALGVKMTQGTYPGARFMAADGYHHHLGLNTWGHPSEPRRAGALGLVEARFARRHASAATLADPDGIRLRIEPMAAQD